jgi:hypothetical protein
MKSRIPAVLLLLGYAIFFSCLFAIRSKLPLHVASHFDAKGLPDGWMPRTMFVKFMGVFGFLFPVFIVGINFVLRYLPAKAFNMPNRNYWMAPERRQQTFQFLLMHSFWLAFFAVLFVGFIYFLVVKANLAVPVRLQLKPLMLATGSFLLGLVWWGVTLVGHFRKTG